MRAFNAATCDGKLVVVIFAVNEAQAAELFCDHHIAIRGSMPGSFSIVRRTLKAERNPSALREALGRDQAGLGMFVDGIWQIEPIPEMKLHAGSQWD